MEEKLRETCMMQMCIARMRHRIIDGRIQKLGIHPGQHFMLVHLSRTDCRLSQAQLAEEMNVSPALVARTLKNLETGGYILRAGSRTDSRRNEISITEKGADVLRRGMEIFREADGQSFEGFAEEEMLQLNALLHKMMNNLKRLEQAEKKEMKQN